MEKLEDKLYVFLNNVCRIFLLGMVCIVSFNVVGRYIFQYTPSWGDEMALFCMTWFGMLSAAMAERRDGHIRVSVLDRIYPKKMVFVLHKFYYLVKLVFAFVLTIEGVKLTITNIPVRMMGIDLSQAWIYVSGPVTGLALLSFLLLRFKKEIIQK